jgi:hypothetical protein
VKVLVSCFAVNTEILKEVSSRNNDMVSPRSHGLHFVSDYPL